MVVSVLAETAREADEATAAARARLVAAVRRAAAEGMTQAEIAREIGRSQPEVSRLLHFHGTSPRARALRRHRDEIKRLVREAGGSNVRVFGSVATGRDHADSDIDLLFTMDKQMGLFALSALEDAIANCVGTEVDLVPDRSIRPIFRDRILGEAIPL